MALFLSFFTCCRGMCEIVTWSDRYFESNCYVVYVEYLLRESHIWTHQYISSLHRQVISKHNIECVRQVRKGFSYFSLSMEFNNL